MIDKEVACGMANTPLYQKEIETSGNTRGNLLKAVAKRESQFISASVMEEYRLGTPRNVSLNKLSLIKRDLIDDVDEIVEFVDPAFELWFNRYYFGVSWSGLLL